MKVIRLLSISIFLMAISSLATGKNKTAADTSKIVTVKDTTTSVKKESKKEGIKSVKEIADKCKKYSGLFNVYQDTVTGKSYLEITEEKIGREYIYFAYVLDGILDAGFSRGGYKDNAVFKIVKYFDRIDFLLQNTSFYFDKNNELSKAENANINQPVFLSEKIAAVSGDKQKTYLIEADNLFLGENFTQIKPAKMPTDKPDAFNLGTLSSKKSKYLNINNYPKNTDVSVEYIYENPAPVNNGTEEVTDARFISIKLQHSIIEMPENNFRPRMDDPRVGFFIEKVNNQTSTSVTPWRDLIHRWDLQKKQPEAAMSEPVQPITWWIEKTTPKEFRPIIKEAVLAWNEAFETAGFKNAVACYEQPDSATWEAEDIRYNVIRWTSSPRPPYGGYGPSFVNPRTGQILGADIMLEFVYLTNRINLEKLYDVSMLDNMQETTQHNQQYCSIGEATHQNILYGMQMLNAYSFENIDKDRFIKQALRDLVLHEVGHTFGLNHNFIASQLHSIQGMQDSTLGATIGLTASVMDYTIPNISMDKSKQGLFFDIKPGLYDKWAIQYGYLSEATEAAEQAALQKVLAASNKKEHRFMNDADDMRNIGRGIDPRANIYDMSDDAIGYATENIKMVNDAMPKIFSKYSTQGQSYHELRSAYLILSGNYARSLNVISRYIGGVYVNRNFIGQVGTEKPFTPVALADQKRAMQTLNKYAFSKDAFKTPDNIYNYLQMQRRGYDFRKENEDPKIHDRILNAQKGVLDALLNANVMQRITDSKLYGNEYGLNTMLSDLTTGIYMEDLNTPVTSVRQNLQEEYISRLLSIIDTKSPYSYTSKSAVFAEVQRIRSLIQLNPGTEASTKAHRMHISYLIKKALDSK